MQLFHFLLVTFSNYGQLGHLDLADGVRLSARVEAAKEAMDKYKLMQNSMGGNNKSSSSNNDVIITLCTVGGTVLVALFSLLGTLLTLRYKKWKRMNKNNSNIRKEDEDEDVFEECV